MDDEVLGRVTSGGLGYGVAESVVYAYLPQPAAAVGTRVGIDLFGVRQPPTVVTAPRLDPAGARVRS